MLTLFKLFILTNRFRLATSKITIKILQQSKSFVNIQHKRQADSILNISCLTFCKIEKYFGIYNYFTHILILDYYI